MYSRLNRSRPHLEGLEDRTVPAVSLMLNASGDLTGIFGPPPPGSLTATLVANNMFTIVENAHTFGTFHVGGNLTLNLGNSLTQSLITVDLGNSVFNGNLTINVGANAHSPIGFGIWIKGDNGGAIAGNLTITTGAGNVNMLVSGANTTVVGSSMSVVMGVGFNTFTMSAATVQGNARIDNFQTAVLGNSSAVGGFLTMDATQAVLFNANRTVFLQNGFTLGGFIDINTGADALDNILFGTGTAVFGVAILNLGNGSNMFTLQSGAAIFGSLTYIGGSDNDIVNLQAGSTVFGSAAFVMGNSGTGVGQLNFLDLAGTILGRQINIIGGNGTDIVVFEGNAPGANLIASLFAGDDQFTLNLTQGSLLSATIDGGFGHNSFLGIGIPNGFRLFLRNFT
jgi:hypothetical protein